MKMQGSLVLENKKGQVVRTLKWTAPKLALVYRGDTRRIEPHASTKELEDAKIPFTLLAEVTPQQVKKGPVEIANIGILRYAEESEKFSPSIAVAEDDTGPFKKAFQWTAAIQIALLILILLIGHFTRVVPAPEEPQRIVKIIPREKAPVVNPMTHRHPLQRIAHTVVKRHPVHRVSQMNMRRHARATHQVAINRLGALAILGQADAADKGGGLSLNAIHTSRGPGLGGTQGSGGIQTSMYARGLIGAPLGPNARADGAGGYGTRGKGGGHAGYGRISLAGSSSSYFEPVERDAVIEGGLDREQIAEVIQRHLGQIRYCYEQGLQVKPGLNGRVAIRFYINGNGYVNTASVSNTSLHSNQVEGCIVSHLKSWKFPNPRGGVVVKVTYPFVLKRVSQS